LPVNHKNTKKLFCFCRFLITTLSHETRIRTGLSYNQATSKEPTVVIIIIKRQFIRRSNMAGLDSQFSSVRTIVHTVLGIF